MPLPKHCKRRRSVSNDIVSDISVVASNLNTHMVIKYHDSQKAK